MERTDGMPMWVFLAYSNIQSRKVALWLVISCAAFSAYCFPWPIFFGNQYWVSKLFLIDDWSWFIMMVPTTLWYWLSLKWVDNNSQWTNITHD